MTGINNNNTPIKSISSQESIGPARADKADAQTPSQAGHMGGLSVRVVTQAMLGSDDTVLSRCDSVERSKISKLHQEFSQMNGHVESSNAAAPLSDKVITQVSLEADPIMHRSFVTTSFLNAVGNGDGYVAACGLAQVDPQALNLDQREELDHRLHELLKHDSHVPANEITDAALLIAKSSEIIRQFVSTESKE
ncbi:hypothetical protein [Thalassospira lucentensis]|uniref:hypothetical protein n=1 Tax=Thalassospira lucentensis TaxID=168935 RepID=UPI00142DE399|nr:hypothetical protein [Thalassospira lucentensis]NIZ03786.1 hypothetical protein [Thalassospira lucentensis]